VSWRFHVHKESRENQQNSLGVFATTGSSTFFKRTTHQLQMRLQQLCIIIPPEHIPPRLRHYPPWFSSERSGTATDRTVDRPEGRVSPVASTEFGGRGHRPERELLNSIMALIMRCITCESLPPTRATVGSTTPLMVVKEVQIMLMNLIN